MQPQETTHKHTRLMKCALEVEECRAYWAHTDGTTAISARQVFDNYWFGARSLERVEVLLVNMRARFDTFPAALQTLHRWPQMAPDTRKLICHWHLQLADPLYRAFTGAYLVSRRAAPRTELTRDLVVSFVTTSGEPHWSMASRVQFASKLLSAAYAAGLVETNRDPRPLVVPRVGDDALEYLLYLLREIAYEGTLLHNPYLASVGLWGAALDERLRTLPSIKYHCQGGVHDVDWRYPSLTAWASARSSRIRT